MADGFAELQAKLHSLRGDAMVRSQRKALKAVGNVIKTEMEIRAPEWDSDGPAGELEAGELKASITARVSVPSDEATLRGKTARVSVGPSGKTRKNGEAMKLIAYDIEYGHMARKSAKREGPVRWIPSSPFVRPAADATEDDAIDAYTESVTADVQKAME